VEYLAERRLDTRLPLVADCGGAAINVSFQSVDEQSGEVRFYAPVFAGVEYRHARPVGEYLRAFLDQTPSGLGDRLVFSCNCILNYVHSGLEGKKTTGFTGPITFGEVAYQLLNQTAVYLEISEANLAERLRAETTLRRQHRLLETLMDTIPDPVFYKDLEGRLLGCNKAYEVLVGRPKAEILGRTIAELFPKEAVDVVTEKNRELLAQPGSQAYPLELRDAAGRTRQVVVRDSTFTAGGGCVAGIIGVLYDVTELQRITGELHTVQGLIPICANCKSLRDDKGYWEDVEIYIGRTSDTRLTHGLCESCIEKLYGEELRAKKRSAGAPR
jgi:PAS domain S-box-containing protein